MFCSDKDQAKHLHESTLIEVEVTKRKKEWNSFREEVIKRYAEAEKMHKTHGQIIEMAEGILN